MAFKIIVSAPVLFLFLWTLDFGIGTWIWDLDLGLDLGLYRLAVNGDVDTALGDVGEGI